MTYEGYFKMGLRHGFGVWKEHAPDEPVGGEYKGKKSAKYEGEYQNDKKEG